MESLETLNKRLVDYYGLTGNGKPRWRLIWSQDQIEKRLNSETRRIEDVPKYWYLAKPCYVLERLFDCGDNIELNALAKYSYEPIWPFDNAEPEWWAIELIYKQCVDLLNKAPHPSKIDKTVIGSPEHYEHDKNRIEDELKCEASPFHGRLRDGEAVGYTKS